MSWFGKSKLARKPNLAENLLALTNATAVARKNRLNEFVPVLVDHIVQEATTFAKTDRNPTTMDIRLLDLFFGSIKVQSLIDRFLNKNQVPLPTGEELNELVPAIKASLEDPNRYGLTVAEASGKMRIDWTTPVVPTEPTVEVKQELKQEVKHETLVEQAPVEIKENEKKESS